MAYRPREITIVGAGLVGSLLATLLGQRGYRVQLLERRSDMRRYEVDAGRSINLALSERGIHALDLAGLMDQVRPLLIPMRGRMLHDEKGNTEFSPYGQRPEEVIYSVSRGGLNRLMMTAAEQHPDVQLRFNQRCQSINFEANRLELTDQVTGERILHDFEILVGADGAGSQVRQAMIRAVGGAATSEFLDHDYKELEIPSGPEGTHRIEREALHIWPRGGFMLIALPNLDGSFTVTLFLPKEGDPGFDRLTGEEEVAAFFARWFPSAASLIPELTKDFFSNPTGPLGTVRCAPWHYQNDSLILGDAAHAIVPFHGQGMNAGFEDCSELIRLLDEHGEDWDAVLPEFSQIRKPCGDAIAQMALENYVTMRDSVLDPQFQLKKELGFALERELPDRFIPRYSMVMFHRIPYDVVLQRGKMQERLLGTLVEGKTSLAEIDLAAAIELGRAELETLPAHWLASSRGL